MLQATVADCVIIELSKALHAARVNEAAMTQAWRGWFMGGFGT